MTSAPLMTRAEILSLLPKIFPEGTPNRLYCTRELAASTIFTALYIGAVEGVGIDLGPVHVYRMTEEQAAKTSPEDRAGYVAAIRKKKTKIEGQRWYADNTREPIRDETLRDGLVAIGAVLKREDVATTAGIARYALKREFAALFDPTIDEPTRDSAIASYQANHLSKSALARVTILLAGAAASSAGVVVTFPNAETRQLSPGPSSFISKSVVEVFAKRFLEKPAVLWLSESGNKVVMRDNTIADAIGLKIQADKDLPDLILADLGSAKPLLVFVEVVATDGAINRRRQKAIYALTDAAGFDRMQVAFVTAYSDRESPGFKKTVAQLAWGSFAWFASEPDEIVLLRHGGTSGALLSALVSI